MENPYRSCCSSSSPRPRRRRAAKAAREAAETALTETRHVFDAPAAERGQGRLLLQPLLPGKLVVRLRCAAVDEAFGLERSVGGTTLAHVAAMRGHDAVLRTLVEAGADAARAASDGATPLHKAASAGHLAAVELLLAAGAPLRVVRRGGASPLLDAAMFACGAAGPNYS
jgi:hypothetical protein